MSAATAVPTQLMFADITQELASTRRMLARVPDGHNDWRPHDKSMLLGRLATHLAELPRFGLMILTTDELDWATKPYEPTVLETTAERLALFDDLAAQMQAELTKADGGTLATEWTMRRGDQIFVKGPKAVLVRSAGMSHMAHHRAQLGVYLRLLGIPLPRIYGPSADEPM